MTPEEYISRLIDISNKKYACIKDILSLTRQQSAVIDADKLPDLHRLIDEKQVLIDAATRLDEDFEVYFRRLKSELRVSSLEELDASRIKGAAELKNIISGIMAAISEINGIEKVNNQNANKLLASLGNEVRKLNQGKKISSAYTPVNPKTASYFIDKKK